MIFTIKYTTQEGTQQHSDYEISDPDDCWEILGQQLAEAFEAKARILSAVLLYDDGMEIDVYQELLSFQNLF